MPRYYVAEWVSCPVCGDPVRITRNNIIFKHTRMMKDVLILDFIRASDYMELCPASRTLYRKESTNDHD